MRGQLKKQRQSRTLRSLSRKRRKAIRRNPKRMSIARKEIAIGSMRGQLKKQRQSRTLRSLSRKRREAIRKNTKKSDTNNTKEDVNRKKRKDDMINERPAEEAEAVEDIEVAFKKTKK